MSDPTDDEALPDKPVKPILKRYTVDDTTVEALVPILNENPRGVVMVCDELIGWVQRMNCYREGGKGADRQFYLSAWSAKDYCNDRKKDRTAGPLRIRKPFVGVIGGLTPDKLPALRGDRPRQKVDQDGFLDRLLLSYAVELPATGENWQDITDESLQLLANAFSKLRTLEMVPVGEDKVPCGWRPHLIKLTESGKAEWQRFTYLHAAERNAPDFPPHLVGPWAKFKGYCGRLALIVHYLRWACGEIQDDKADLDGESMKRAVRLVNYFKAHARKVYAAIDADPRIADARKVLAWIVRENRKCFKRWEAYEDLKSDARFSTPDSLDTALELLAQHQIIREEPQTERPGPGRRRAPVFEVNPLLLSSPANPVNPANPKTSQKRSPHPVDSQDLQDLQDESVEENGNNVHGPERESEESGIGLDGSDKDLS